MTNFGFVAASYLVTVGAVVGYVVHILRAGRRVSQQVAPEQRRWM